eukprot:TRINITY_DN23637_c0_g1_i4.p1 TRINITY_DN23637_c0_g1~~TRINITY_DN23637_c0_g1_i4.p1  ORF type:complete len:1294 (+),score=255.51 TRINITY_DN23637_c0_g1_i4:420-3884(+)
MQVALSADREKMLAAWLGEALASGVAAASSPRACPQRKGSAVAPPTRPTPQPGCAPEIQVLRPAAGRVECAHPGGEPLASAPPTKADRRGCASAAAAPMTGVPGGGVSPPAPVADRCSPTAGIVPPMLDCIPPLESRGGELDAALPTALAACHESLAAQPAAAGVCTAPEGGRRGGSGATAEQVSPGAVAAGDEAADAVLGSGERAGRRHGKSALMRREKRSRLYLETQALANLVAIQHRAKEKPAAGGLRSLSAGVAGGQGIAVSSATPVETAAAQHGTLVTCNLSRDLGALPRIGPLPLAHRASALVVPYRPREPSRGGALSSVGLPIELRVGSLGGAAHAEGDGSRVAAACRPDEYTCVDAVHSSEGWFQSPSMPPRTCVVSLASCTVTEPGQLPPCGTGCCPLGAGGVELRLRQGRAELRLSYGGGRCAREGATQLLQGAVRLRCVLPPLLPSAVPAALRIPAGLTRLVLPGAVLRAHCGGPALRLCAPADCEPPSVAAQAQLARGLDGMPARIDPAAEVQPSAALPPRAAPGAAAALHVRPPPDSPPPAAAPAPGPVTGALPQRSAPTPLAQEWAGGGPCAAVQAASAALGASGATAAQVSLAAAAAGGEVADAALGQLAVAAVGGSSAASLGRQPHSNDADPQRAPRRLQQQPAPGPDAGGLRQREAPRPADAEPQPRGLSCALGDPSAGLSTPQRPAPCAPSASACPWAGDARAGRGQSVPLEVSAPLSGSSEPPHWACPRLDPPGAHSGRTTPPPLLSPAASPQLQPAQPPLDAPPLPPQFAGVWAPLPPGEAASAWDTFDPLHLSHERRAAAAGAAPEQASAELAAAQGGRRAADALARDAGQLLALALQRHAAAERRAEQYRQEVLTLQEERCHMRANLPPCPWGQRLRLDYKGRGGEGVVYHLAGSTDDSAIKYFTDSSGVGAEAGTAIAVRRLGHAWEVHLVLPTGLHAVPCSCANRSHICMTYPAYDGDLATAAAEVRLDLLDALAAFRAVLRGAALLHAVGSAHGDIKPQNVMATWRQGGWLARIALGDVGGSHQTPAWLPPDRVGWPATHVTDVYSATLVFIDLCTGCSGPLPPAQRTSVGVRTALQMVTTPPGSPRDRLIELAAGLTMNVLGRPPDQRLSAAGVLPLVEALIDRFARP